MMEVTKPYEIPASAASFVVDKCDQPLHDHVRQAIEYYFTQLSTESTNKVYETALAQVEPPLIEAVLRYTNGNQSRAAVLLGLSRGTLRKKMKQYGMLE